MPTKSVSQDRNRISTQKHELSYAGSKTKGGRKAIVKAKKALGRTTSRKKIMARAAR